MRIPDVSADTGTRPGLNRAGALVGPVHARGLIAEPCAEALTRRLEQLANVSAELAAAETMQDVIDAAVTHVATAMSSAACTLMLVEGQELVLVASHGVTDGAHQSWARFDLDLPLPACDAVRSGRMVMYSSEDDAVLRYPALRGTMDPARSMVCLPLGSHDAPVGALGIVFERGWLPARNELDVLGTFAYGCGQSIRRIHAADQARVRADQLAFLADAAAVLSRNLDHRDTLASVARLAVPVLADWCSVDLAGDGGTSATIEVAHVDPARAARARTLQERFPPDPNATSGAPFVMRTGKSEFHPVIADDSLAEAVADPHRLRMLRSLDMHSVIVVPMTARGRTLGAISLIRGTTRPEFTRADLSVAEDLGRRAGIAIDNALLLRQSRNVALQLQEAALPDSLADVEGWDIACHYAPGGRAGVGGDFYDAVRLDDHRLAFAIGDIMGHGIEAAAAMSQIRSSIRAFLCLDPHPEVVMARLDRMFDQLRMRRLVTMVYGVVDLDRRTVTFVNAGHYPPVLVRDDGAAGFLEAAPMRLLGAGSIERFAVHARFEPTDTLLLYTDGLIEQRDIFAEDGLAHLKAVAGDLAGDDLRDALTGALAQMGPNDGQDDITALAFRADRAVATARAQAGLPAARVSGDRVCAVRN